MGNTKITSNAIHGRLTKESLRAKNKPVGKFIGIPEIYHVISGISDVVHNWEWLDVATASMEYRGRTKISLDRRGNVRIDNDDIHIGDAVYSIGPSHSIRCDKLSNDRQFTENQKLLMRRSELKYMNQDKIGLYSVRPAELLYLVRSVKHYFEWFVFSKTALKEQQISDGLDSDIRKCLWIDGLGRRVWLRRAAMADFKDDLRRMSDAGLPVFAKNLRHALIHMAAFGDPTMERNLVLDDGKANYPIAVFSKVVPEQNMKFVLHVLLVLGEYDTELDLKAAGSLRKAFVLAGLVREVSLEDPESMRVDLMKLMKRIVDEIIPYQPVGEKRLDTFITRSYTLLESLLLNSSIPMNEYPPCLASELQKSAETELNDRWKSQMAEQLQSSYLALESVKDLLPPIELVMDATKEKPP